MEGAGVEGDERARYERTDARWGRSSLIFNRAAAERRREGCAREIGEDGRAVRAVSVNG